MVEALRGLLGFGVGWLVEALRGLFAVWFLVGWTAGWLCPSMFGWLVGCLLCFLVACCALSALVAATTVHWYFM